VQLGKFSAVVTDVTVFGREGFNLPTGQNAPHCLGIAIEGIAPNFAPDCRNGSYEGFSQAAWPGNLIPTSPQGSRRMIVRKGRVTARAAGAVNRGDRCIIANNLGQLASVVTLGLAGGMEINVVGVADEPAVNPGDLFHVMVNPYIDTV
jgi:hypothetical protein